MTDFAKLIPELPDWNNGKGIDVESWIDCIGTFQLAVGYSTLLTLWLLRGSATCSP